MTGFFRFPHVPHLAWLGSDEPRDDKVLSPAAVSALLSSPVVTEEKLDGANLGISLTGDGTLRVQNRGQYLEAPFAGQFIRLDAWLALHEDALFDHLSPYLTAFGEWCAARHSLEYTALPDWWLVFDVYDHREGRFWSTCRRDAWAHQAGLSCVPSLSRGRTGRHELVALLDTQRSRYRDGPMEGIVVRSEDDRWLRSRAKLVRSDFTQHIDRHWRERPIAWNRLKLAS